MGIRNSLVVIFVLAKRQERVVPQTHYVPAINVLPALARHLTQLWVEHAKRIWIVLAPFVSLVFAKQALDQSLSFVYRIKTV